jgi:hypothetical protein
MMTRPKHLLPKGRIALSKNLLGILDELEEKHYFIYPSQTKSTVLG